MWVIAPPKGEGITLISKGNLKLGKLPSFSLPVITTCPGKTLFCEAFCFGLKGNFILPSVKDTNERRLEASTRSDFVPIIEREIRKTKAPAFRLHVVGDFYSVEYIRKWIEIATDLENVIFFGSTRTWRCGFMGEVMKDLRDMANVFMKASTDGTDDLDPTIVGWRIWSIDGAGDPCPHDYSIVEDCNNCGRCWKQRDTDTSFRLRWGKQEDYLALVMSKSREN